MRFPTWPSTLALLLVGVAVPQTPVLAAAPALVGPVDSAPLREDDARDDEDGRDDQASPRVHLAADLPPETPAAIRTAATSDAPVGDWNLALALAYWTSPAILAQRALVKSYDYRVPEARAAYGLQLDYQLMQGWQRDRNDPTALQRQLGQITPMTSWGFSNSAMAVLTMPLFTFGRNASAERSAAAQRAYQKQVLRSTEQGAFYDAVAAYAGLIRDRASVAIARDNLTALDRATVAREALDLKSGMPAEVHIASGSRSLLSYVIKPLRDQFARAFRDN